MCFELLDRVELDQDLELPWALELLEQRAMLFVRAVDARGPRQSGRRAQGDQRALKERLPADAPLQLRASPAGSLLSELLCQLDGMYESNERQRSEPAPNWPERPGQRAEKGPEYLASSHHQYPSHAHTLLRKLFPPVDSIQVGGLEIKRLVVGWKSCLYRHPS